MVQWLMNPTRNHEVSGLIPGIAMSYGVGLRHNSDPAWLWLWHRPVATAPIRPLAWEPPYAMGVAPGKRQKDKKKRNYYECLRAYLNIIDEFIIKLFTI